ncbi:MAG: glycosyltransferase [Oxalobacteraceae bacterium]|nr:MAG: glycosyltransferase [Oxalobacteraceae bacterium]
MKLQMPNPQVAVPLATYNGAAHCETQLISILWQRGVDVHVYVRDDGSRDATPSILHDWAERHPDRMTIIDNNGLSTGAATGNFFLLLSAVDPQSYDYVAFADQDDVWTPDKLLRATDRLVQEDAEGYSSDLIAYETGANSAWVLHKAGRVANLDYLFQGGSAGCTYVLSSRAAKVAAEVMEQAPALCSDASHDWILYAICRSRGMKWVRDQGAEILYRQHASNLYGAKRGLAEVRAKLRDVRSSWYHDHILWMRHVVLGSEVERSVLDAVARGRFSDRWWLVRQAGQFRRTRTGVVQLRIALALGMI